MRNTRDIEERFKKAYEKCDLEDWDEAVTHCITLALASIPDPEPLSDELRRDAEYISTCGHVGATSERVAAELLRRCPKPAPKQRDPKELEERLREWHPSTAAWSTALDELVALAEKNK